MKRGGTTAYRYDDFERIAEINNGTPITYEYDEYGQIIRENNKVLNKTFVYGYDSIGNICVRQERVLLKTKFFTKMIQKKQQAEKYLSVCSELFFIGTTPTFDKEPKK